MPTLLLPDGKSLQLAEGGTGYDLARAIAPSLAKKAMAVCLDGDLCDLHAPILGDKKARLILRKDKEALDLIRHDAAHLLAQAVKKLYPETQITIGPVIENGFYYDIAPLKPFTSDDLPVIEREMQKLVDADLPTSFQVMDKREAVAMFKGMGEFYKAEIIEDLPDKEEIRVYTHGDWKDLCRGPHLPSTRHIGKAFKLTHLAGAYWRGDSSKAMLQRIYGTAWRTKDELAAYLHRLEEEKKRDHRKLGREMELFHLQSEAQGSVFWHPKGTDLWNVVESYMRRRQIAHGYKEVRTPQLLDAAFWKRSGHWQKFREQLFIVPDKVHRESANEGAATGLDTDKLMALKPMNCPAHVMLFNKTIRSYRDLPLRLSEFGCCHRNEAHGALYGLMRVRQMTQDDAHVFCTYDQIIGEVQRFSAMLDEIYADFGFSDYRVKLATRPPVRAGDDALWDKAEADLARAAALSHDSVEDAPGEAAFYGPKLEFHLKDAIGRSWQCGTLQLDFVLPQRLGAQYVGADGKLYHPVMLHRAVLGTLERFIGILIENYAGDLPLWLAPLQVLFAPIVTDVNDYAIKAKELFQSSSVRCEADRRNQKINAKIRDAELSKIPVIAVIGKKEAGDKTLTLRFRGDKQQKTLPLEEALALIQTKAMPPDLVA